jgi:thiamine biosynthesis lipoprotein
MKPLAAIAGKSIWLCGLAVCAAMLVFAYSRLGLRTAEQPITFSGLTMGTSYTVKLVEPPPSLDLPRLAEEIQRRLDGIDALMSTYRPDSELSRLNQYEGSQWFAVSPQTAAVIDEAIRVGRLTDGAFDVTVGPLVELWNFGPRKGTRDRVPSAAEINAARRQLGLDALEVRLSPPAVRKTRKDVRVDLSGIAKGFAVDQLAEHLELRGVHNYLIEVGGELRAEGRNHHKTPWQVAVESPVAGIRSVERVVPLDGAAMATSGDYRNYFEQDGVRYCHIIDPRSGRPITHRLASATVIAPACSRADAVATALMVLGPEAGYELAQREKLAVLLLVKTDAGFEEKSTVEFRNMLP